VDKDAGYMMFHIRKRPWYVWLLRAAWILWLAFWMEFAIGAWLEREQPAYSIAVKVLLVSFLFGLTLYFWRRRRTKGASS
jgi:hypothetical protein